MTTKFNKGSELDKQIYPEGESTWGCKSGVLDVEDVKDWIKEILNGIEAEFNLVCEIGKPSETLYVFKQQLKNGIKFKVGERLT